MRPAGKNTAARLRAFARRVDRETNELLSPRDWLPCSVFAAVARPKRVFIFPRDALVRRLLAEKLWPKEWAAVVRYGVPPPWFARAVAERCDDLDVEPDFVGDLDPLDLHIFLAYRSAEPWLRGRTRLPFRFLGVNDRWLEHGTRSSSRMEDWERKHLELLADVVDLEPIIGPNSLALLKGGRKLELEGASSKALLGRNILKRIVPLLRERAA